MAGRLGDEGSGRLGAPAQLFLAVPETGTGDPLLALQICASTLELGLSSLLREGGLGAEVLVTAQAS